MRKQLFAFGRKRRPEYVRGFTELVDGVSKVRVQWNLGERTRTESFDDTRKGIAEAKAFAEGVHERLSSRTPEAPVSISLRLLLEKHIAAKESEWRPNTLRLLRWRWDKLELHTSRTTPAHLVTREVLDSLKGKLLESHSPNQVRLAIKAVTSVFRWGVDRDLIPPTKVVTYTAKFSKDIERTAPKMSEFSADERGKVIAQLDPRDSRQWRAWALTNLLAYCGPRQLAARHLWWSDIDLDAGVIRWRAETDKMGAEREQPIPEPVRDALLVAYGWTLAFGYTGPFVFFRPGAGTRSPSERGTSENNWSGAHASRSAARSSAKPDKPWTYQAYLDALHKAEVRAGLTPVKWKGAHAMRRGVAGDVHAATGSSKKAANWIGDKSIKVVEKHYLLERAEEMRKTSALVGGPATEPATSSESNPTKPNEISAQRPDGAASVN